MKKTEGKAGIPTINSNGEYMMPVIITRKEDKQFIPNSYFSINYMDKSRQEYNQRISKLKGSSAIIYLFIAGDITPNQTIYSINTKHIMESLGLKIDAVKGGLKILKELEYLVPTGKRGEYYINVTYFFNGARTLDMVNTVNDKILNINKGIVQNATTINNYYNKENKLVRTEIIQE